MCNTLYTSITPSTNSEMGRNDYSLLTARIAISTISTANSSMSGVGATNIITGASNGTVIKSIIIQALVATTPGMVRLFVGSGVTSIFQEISIPQISTGKKFQLELNGELRLKSGQSLYTSTQNNNQFNIIVEASDWEYPASLPDGCCNYMQETSVSESAVASTANPNLDGSGVITQILSPTSLNGTTINKIRIKALQNTSQGMVRLFLSPDSGTTYHLFKEIEIPASTHSAIDPSYSMSLEPGYCIESGFSIGASTELSESFAVVIEATSWSYPI